MSFPYGVTVTIRSTVTTDDGLGNTTEETVDHEWPGVAFAPRTSVESADPRVAPVVVGEDLIAMSPPPVAIDSDDEIVYGETVWQVDGLPESYFGEHRNPFTGWEAGIRVPVRRVAAV